MEGFKKNLALCARNQTLRVHYVVGSPLELVGFTDLDWDGDYIDKMYTLGYVFMLENGPICYSSNKKHTISLSSVEADYRGAVNTVKHCVWVQGILGELGFAFDSPPCHLV